MIDRREALRQLGLISLSVFVIPACSKKPSCQDVSGLSTDEVNQRQNIAQYQEQSMDAVKRCQGCVQFVPGPKDACGSCKVVKGPINPEGGCKLWTAKPA